ncbi:Mce family protein [Gordonia hirsuta DSM 44140 = NBRC 16056]|uniref:Mce family protein n=1 Tax=Gordonia hirsuta DSM 44140 = NBRC 16056 TaxID=1121927 RepID=L7LAC8_9ACTN|nr:Mce family protein [Gordonia hirsuta DSM 44140 = NBRC 16056]
MMRVARLAAVLLAIVAVFSGCSIRATDLPLPGTAMSGEQYRIEIVFRTALNLPDKAKVYLEGVEVGKVDAVDIEDRYAVAEVDIRSDVVLSTRTVAKVKQSSLMGDLFVELSLPDDPNSDVLQAGGRIPISQTEPPDNIEDMLRAMAMFVAGAPAQDIASLINEVNEVMPGPKEIASLSEAGKRNLSELAASTDEISSLLDSAGSISKTFGDNAGRVDFMLQQGPPRVAGLKDVLYGVIDLMMSLAHFTKPIEPMLVPLTPDLHKLIGILTPAGLAIADADRSLVANVKDVNALMRDRLIPFLGSPLNVSIRGGTPAQGTPAQRADALIGLLRGIGMIR